MAGKEMPEGILSMTPIDSDPHGRGAVTADGGKPGTEFAPGATMISPNVRAALDKQAEGVSNRVNDFLARKLSPPHGSAAFGRHHRLSAVDRRAAQAPRRA
jgi:hypothetical protein